MKDYELTLIRHHCDLFYKTDTHKQTREAIIRARVVAAFYAYTIVLENSNDKD